MFCLGSLFKNFLPWSWKHSPKLASKMVALKLACASVAAGELMWAHLSGLHCRFLAQGVLTLLLWALHSKNHWSRSFVVLTFTFMSIICQKLWSISFHFSLMEVQVPFADQIVLSTLFCKPSVQKYMNLFLGPSVSTGLSLPWARPTLSCYCSTMVSPDIEYTAQPSFPFSAHVWPSCQLTHTHTHTHTHTLLEFSLKVN